MAWPDCSSAIPDGINVNKNSCLLHQYFRYYIFSGKKWPPVFDDYFAAFIFLSYLLCSNYFHKLYSFTVIRLGTFILYSSLF